MASYRASRLLAGAIACCVAVPAFAGDCPELVGRWPYGPSHAVAVSDDYAYFGSGTTLQVAEVWYGTPRARGQALPRVVGEVVLDGLVQDIAVSNGYVYVAAGPAGLRVVDVSTPSDPVEVGFVDTPGDARRVAISGNYAFVADGAEGLRILDVTSAEHPFEVGAVGRAVLAVAASEGYVYIAMGNKLGLIDVSDPENPAWISSKKLPFTPTTLAFWASSAPLGEYLFAVGAGGVVVLNVSAASRPYEVYRGFDAAAATALAVSRDDVYVAVPGAVLILDFSTPVRPVEVGHVDLTFRADDLAVSGGLVVVAADDAGLRVVDASDPTSPFVAGFVDTPGISARIAVAADHAYVTGDGLRVIDVLVPSDPVEVASLEGPAEDVVVAGGYAYVAAGDEGLRIIDVFDPRNPVEVNVVPTREPLGPGSVAVSDGYAYIAAGDEGLRVIDISNPAAPFEVGWLQARERAEFVAVAGRHAYVTFSSGTGRGERTVLAVIDVSIPSAPFPVSALPVTCGCLTAVGDRVYVGHYRGLQVVDVSAPLSPSDVGFVETPERVTDVGVAGSFAFVAADSAGFQVIDVSRPDEPVILRSYDTPGRTRGVAVAGGYVYATDSDAGLDIFDLSRCTPARAPRHPRGRLPP